MDGLESAFPHGAPSLMECRSLLIHGPIVCEPGVVFRGDVIIHNHSENVVHIKAGTYSGKVTVQ